MNGRQWMGKFLLAVVFSACLGCSMNMSLKVGNSADGAGRRDSATYNPHADSGRKPEWL